MMNQAGHAARKISPMAGVAAAGLTAGAAGAWAWRWNSPTAKTEREASSAGKVDGTPAPASPALSTAPTPTPPPDVQMMQRGGPMVAVYLDTESVERLQQEYPGTNPGRLRKVVIQYNPSADQLSSYERHFGGLATVKLTGEASSDHRLALMASVSSAGTSVEPQSLSCALDVTPGDVGGGPLASTVLIEQIKRSGAVKQESWNGSLPAISAHERDFPSEEGSYSKLDEALTLTGSICRADWVEGMSGLCRTTTAEGRKREDGWTPQACIICNTLEASPCRDIYKMFDSLDKRIRELEPPNEAHDGAEKPAVGADDAISGGEGSGTTEGEGEDEDEHEQGKTARESGDDSSKALETEGDKLRRAQVEQLKHERQSVFYELRACWGFHHVFGDANADDGVVPDMGDEEEVEAGGDVATGKGTSSGGGEGDSSGMAAEDKTAQEVGHEPPADTRDQN